ncbi:enoyl-CoA hydratase [Tamaricihabitans halophyticus]|uniref:Enoyl-CoA hydratase n=1 Tax=Tamaricihabitans halophyticus TaxID=1262583 RepID=A0A4R2QFG7_9PSEU|nr:enoyl-CoA hydratase/isomerase family protein [Tamaricihabitans halophyticus]TCP47882.1 enoyl-CoA hydratase [Tamaricihabitans halophyticus]
MTAGLKITQTNDVLRIGISVPDRRNALSRAMLREIRSTVDQSRDAHAVLLTGNHETFSAGADLHELTGTAADATFDDTLTAACEAIRATPVPVIAAIEGACIGAAVELALSCDMTIGGESAWLRVPAIRLGLLYNPRGIERFHRRLDRATISRLLLFGLRCTASEAVRAGLLAEVVSTGTALARAEQLAAELPPAPRPALAHTKELLAALDEGRFDESHWQAIRTGLLESPERTSALAQARQPSEAAGQ